MNILCTAGICKEFTDKIKNSFNEHGDEQLFLHTVGCGDGDWNPDCNILNTAYYIVRSSDKYKDLSDKEEQAVDYYFDDFNNDGYVNMAMCMNYFSVLYDKPITFCTAMLFMSNRDEGDTISSEYEGIMIVPVAESFESSEECLCPAVMFWVDFDYERFIEDALTYSCNSYIDDEDDGEDE